MDSTGGADSETTVEIKIKTLDSQTYILRVDKCVPVPALKEQIATVTGVLSEQQRLICRGKVLKDDELLSAYHVEDGHTLHLVVRQPLQSASTSYTGLEGALGLPGSSSAPGNTHNRGSPVAHSFVFESVNVDQGDNDNSVISRIISSMLDSIGPTSARTGNTANDIREMISERLARASSDGGISDSTHPHPNPSNSQRGSRFSSATPLGPQNPAVIPDSLTTLNQYISFMKDEYWREGISANGGNGTHLNVEQNHDSHSHAAQGGLPSPASLAEIVLSTRRLLMEQTGESLSQLARQLEGHTNVTDILTRMNMQSSAVRLGVLMRNLGSMLLELGRTTMTLRMGQSPAEAIVNAGPATFISANGPTPLLVQPVPFYPGPNTSGIHVGPAISSNGLEGEQPDAAVVAAFVPRNIEIRIRTVGLGRAVPIVSTGNANDQPSSQQQQEQTDPLRNSLVGGESGVRVVPLRTVVNVPSGVNSSLTDQSSNPVRLMYPILARVRQQSTLSANDSSGSQDQWQTDNSESRDDGHVSPPSSVPIVSGVNIPSNESGTYQGVAGVNVSSRQSPLNNNSNGSTQADVDAARNDGSHDTSGVGSDQGVFLSNVLRQIIPFLSRGREDGASTSNLNSTAEVERENLDGSRSSQHRRDPAESPSSKRMKKNE